MSVAVSDCQARDCAGSSSDRPAGIPACSGSQQRQRCHNTAGLSCCMVEYFVFAAASWRGRCGRKDSSDSARVERSFDSESAPERRPGAVGIDSWLERWVDPDFRQCRTCSAFAQRAAVDSDMATFDAARIRSPFPASSPSDSAD